MKILSIDIGYHNMALVLAECVGAKINVEYIKKVSLEDYKHIYSNDIVDLVPLFVDDHHYIFKAADKILIERQPPGGLTNIETLLHYMFKDRGSRNRDEGFGCVRKYMGHSCTKTSRKNYYFRVFISHNLQKKFLN